LDLGLIVSVGVGCATVLNFDGLFYNFINVFSLFWGIIVVFGYTTAIATVEYPEM
jgi:NADH-ubiquinone oxidoreductase chain 6